MTGDFALAHKGFCYHIFKITYHIWDIPLTYPTILLVWIYTWYIPEAFMEQASVFKSNKSQAVRLPKPVALPEDVKRVDIIALGRARLIAPAGEAWDSWFDGEGVTEDFMGEREQPKEQQRESF